ncbi:hypothetical protein BO71DRAFT_402864 [Aspergillus ellipticus CBS 707.79]|uniref:Phosphatidylglycerol lysyltransferase C-terminal domain-containing protein n=1 Tax=Aspergillus ellipticus CBS 707.79 TaxID=1448320 RepID=A0A319CWQ1_9EURO|nr:hypothetical protein BO71DRAFT_402864 [Aspergillus ellipticus CBS 707.79]
MSPSAPDQSSPEPKKVKGKSNPSKQPPQKVLLADQIGQSLYDQLLESRLHAHADSLHHRGALHGLPHTQWPSAPRSSSSSSSSTKSTTATSSSSLKSLASSRTSHDSSSSSDPTHKPTAPIPIPTTTTTSPSTPPLTTTPSSPPESSKTTPRIQTLTGLTPLGPPSITHLAAHHGQISHMGLLDPSYHIFLNLAHTGALCYKVLNKVAIIAGDPLCHDSVVDTLLSEFKIFRKRIVVQSRQLVKGGMGVEVYVPGYYNRNHTGTGTGTGTGGDGDGDGETDGETDGGKAELERELRGIYDAWRAERNTSGTTQTFITEYDPFEMPELMTYIYCKGGGGATSTSRESGQGQGQGQGQVEGFAALRWLGAKGGYHIDPCIARPGAPRGVSDLLVFSAMALLRKVGVSYLGFGYEPFADLGEVVGLPGPVEKVTRMVYRYTFQRLPISGKKAYHDRFRPDGELDQGLFLVFPSGLPEVRHLVAMTHVANISIRRLVFRVG